MRSFLKFLHSSARYYAQQILDFDQHKKTTSVDVGNPSFSTHVTHEPMGVAGLIVPWNYPILMASWKVRLFSSCINM